MSTTASTLVHTAADGPQLSRIVAGAWRMTDWKLSVADRQRWIEQCIELGVTSFDHADIYGNYGVEAQFGEALAAAPGLRERIQIVTKCGIKLISDARPQHALKSYDSSRAHVMASVDQSLAALKTDYIDLLLIHRPDLLMDADELSATFQDLRAAGKVRHFGVSNFTPSQFALLNRRFPLTTNQIELSPLHHAPLHDGTLDQCQDLGVRPMIWSPLAGGRLFSSGDDQSLRTLAVISDLAHRYGVAPATIVYAWILRHPARPLPITGSRRIELVREAVAALSFELDAESWYAILAAAAGHEVP
jgi:predicted oxidoreductase